MNNIFGLLCFLAMGFWTGIGVGLYVGYGQATHEAYNLGLAKECLGRTGYHFTCEKDE